MRIRALAVSAAVATLALLAVAAPAHADDGDGLAACNRGEICFQGGWDNFTTSTFQRHFWWSDWDHSDDLLADPSNHEARPLADGARGFWNRDTECNVGLWDMDSSGNLYLYTVVPANFSAGDWAGDRNNAHSRCPST